MAHFEFGTIVPICACSSQQSEVEKWKLLKCVSSNQLFRILSKVVLKVNVYTMQELIAVVETQDQDLW